MTAAHAAAHKEARALLAPLNAARAALEAAEKAFADAKRKAQACPPDGGRSAIQRASDLKSQADCGLAAAVKARQKLEALQVDVVGAHKCGACRALRAPGCGGDEPRDNVPLKHVFACDGCQRIFCRACFHAWQGTHCAWCDYVWNVLGEESELRCDANFGPDYEDKHEWTAEEEKSGECETCRFYERC